MRARIAYAIGCALTGALGAATLVYRGPAQGFVRGTVADALVTAFLYWLLGALWPRRAAARAAIVAALALAVELHQLTAIAAAPRSLATEVTLGSTFDPWDFAAYAIGLAVAVLAERALRAQGTRTTRSNISSLHRQPPVR